VRGYRTRIKICGLTDPVDAGVAVDLGADLLGFVFAPGPRQLRVEEAFRFWMSLPRGVPKIGVFKDQREEQVQSVLSSLSLDYLQFHGNESQEFCCSFGLPVIRACSARSVEDLKFLDGWDCADLFLVDLPKEDAGGVLARDVAEAAALLAKPALLAGGLDPENVGDLVRSVRPYGVDVARGVEREPGKKDLGKMRLFIERVRGVVE
jgi:phosphoribosylanthranilate isomerase